MTDLDAANEVNQEVTINPWLRALLLIVFLGVLGVFWGWMFGLFSLTMPEFRIPGEPDSVQTANNEKEIVAEPVEVEVSAKKAKVVVAEPVDVEVKAVKASPTVPNALIIRSPSLIPKLEALAASTKNSPPVDKAPDVLPANVQSVQSKQTAVVPVVQNKPTPTASPLAFQSTPSVQPPTRTTPTAKPEPVRATINFKEGNNKLTVDVRQQVESLGGPSNFQQASQISVRGYADNSITDPEARRQIAIDRAVNVRTLIAKQYDVPVEKIRIYYDPNLTAKSSVVEIKTEID